MFGDLLGGLLQTRIVDSNGTAQAELPLGTGRSYKITENSKPLPMDRLFFNYNGFQNALATQRGIPGIPGASVLGDANVDRYTLGAEKTFFDGTASIEVRMPFVGGFNSTNNFSYAITSGNVGDLSLFYKDLLYADDMVSLAAGLGLGLPTGDDVDFRILGDNFTLHNDSVHLMPYVGAMVVPNDYWFFQMFLEIDFAASSNEFTADRQNIVFGQVTEQNLFHASLSGGYWLHDNPEARYLQGIAAIMELHYTTAINDGDNLFFAGAGATGFLGNPFNRVDFLNLTSGLQFQIGPLSNLRVGCAVPLHESGENRQFDAEIQVQFNRYFD